MVSFSCVLIEIAGLLTDDSTKLVPLNEFLFLSVADESAVRINIGINMKSNLASTMRGKAIYYCERHVNGIPESASTKLSIRFTLACGGGSSMGGSTFEPLVPAS